MSMEAVVMTCLEPWVVDAIDSVNSQEKPFDKKHLLIDETFLDDSGKKFLESLKEKLNDWQVYTHFVNNDFSSHKNWMLDQLSKNEEWILWLDADEVIDKKFVSTATLMIEYSDKYSENKVDAYAPAFVHSFEGRDGELHIDWLNPETPWYPDWHPRFFKNHQHTYFLGLVHEVLCGWKTLVPISDPKMTILHRKTIAMQAVSNKRWRKLEALRREKDPEYLGHIQGEDWEKFINAFED
jgi:hypothetical protein